jgi:hypothetical protein
MAVILPVYAKTLYGNLTSRRRRRVHRDQFCMPSSSSP